MTKKLNKIVDIIAPASFSSSDDLILSYDILKKIGLSPRTFIDFDTYHPFHSDEDEIRFQDLKRALYAEDSHIIWCLRGGYGTARLVEKLSKLKKPKKEKIFIGYSDITALHLFLENKWGWKTIHAPTISIFKNKELKKSIKETLHLISNEKSSYAFKLMALNELAEEKINITANLSGGNLAIVQTSLGTKFQIDLKNKILMLEDVGERGYQIDRMLNHLKMSGVLKNCKAIVFGDFTGGEEKNGESFVMFSLVRFALEQKIPVFKCDDFGHGKKNFPFMYNRKYKLTNTKLILV